MPKITYVGRFRLRWPLSPLMALAFVALTIAAAKAQPTEPALQAFQTFEKTTQDYVRVHRRLEEQIGPIEIGTPATEINRIIRQLATAIRADRADAKQGDFFTPSLTRVLRTRIKDALLEHGYTADDVRAAGRVDGVDNERVSLQVNDTFPWRLGAAMFPCVIEVLPPLPPELQCRFVGDDLILIDIHARLIVDILPSALNDVTARNSRRQGSVSWPCV